jgi:prophage DNA circulation protein
MVDIVGLYNTLLTATFGGVPFSVIDTRQETGRRVQRFVFPGVDDASFQDLGADDGPITIRGLLYGQDYLAQATLLQAVFRSAGPYTLVHPWLGKKQVILAPGQRPSISLTATELQIARFELAVLPYNPSAAAGLDTLAKLETELAAVTAAAENWLANVMQPAVNVLGAFSYVQSWLTSISGVFTAALAVTPSANTITGAANVAISDLTSITTAPSLSWGGTTTAQVAAVPAAIAGAATPPVPSAVAPGSSTTAATAADPGDVVTTLLATIPGIAAGAANPSPGPALAAGLQALVVAQAVQAASNITYTSQQDAQAEAAVLYAAIDAAAVAAGTAAQSDPANAAPVWRNLVSLKGALAADMNAVIGRLPPVVMITVPRVMPVWLLAHYVSGDDPGAVYGTYQDIIARNNVYHPALLQPGQIEVLDV